MLLRIEVNGFPEEVVVDGPEPLADVLREKLGVTSLKVGCDDCECGACMVLLDDRPVNSCTTLALQADGAKVTTAEGLGSGGALSRFQEVLLEECGVQCGFCTPGVCVAAEAYLRDGGAPDEKSVKQALAGNLCRCTGYSGIVRAVSRVAEERRRESA